MRPKSALPSRSDLPPDEFHVTLGFSGVNVSPTEISKQLDMKADYEHRAGDQWPLRTREGGPTRHYVLPEGRWYIESKLEPTAPLEEHVSWLLDRIEPHRRRVLRLAKRGLTPCFQIGYFANRTQGGPSLSAALLRRIAALSAEMIFDIYPERRGSPLKS